MDKQLSETEFFKMYDLVKAYADKAELSVNQVMSIREVWDLAYITGHSHGMAKALNIVKGNTATETE
jgi:hypothetical protein